MVEQERFYTSVQHKEAVVWNKRLYTRALHTAERVRGNPSPSPILRGDEELTRVNDYLDGTPTRQGASLAVAGGLGVASWALDRFSPQAGFLSDTALISSGGAIFGNKVRPLDRLERFIATENARRDIEGLKEGKLETERKKGGRKFRLAHFFAQFDDVVSPKELELWWKKTSSESYREDPRYEIVRAYFETQAPNMSRSRRRRTTETKDKVIRKIMTDQVLAQYLKLSPSHLRLEKAKTILDIATGMLAVKGMGAAVTFLINSIIPAPFHSLEQFVDSVADDVVFWGSRLLVSPFRRAQRALSLPALAPDISQSERVVFNPRTYGGSARRKPQVKRHAAPENITDIHSRR